MLKARAGWREKHEVYFGDAASVDISQELERTRQARLAAMRGETLLNVAVIEGGPDETDGG